MQNRTKVKIRKWLGISALPQYERFLIVWHDLRKYIQEEIAGRQSDVYTQKINVRMLEVFYQTPYDTAEDFYAQFEKRQKGFQTDT